MAIDTDEMGRALAERLRDARDHAGMSQAELARAAKMSIPQVYRLERGDGGRALLSTIAALAEALCVDPGWLAFGSAGAAPRWVRLRARQRR